MAVCDMTVSKNVVWPGQKEPIVAHQGVTEILYVHDAVVLQVLSVKLLRVA